MKRAQDVRVVGPIGILVMPEHSDQCIMYTELRVGHPLHIPAQHGPQCRCLCHPGGEDGGTGWLSLLIRVATALIYCEDDTIDLRVFPSNGYASNSIVMRMVQDNFPPGHAMFVDRFCHMINHSEMDSQDSKLQSRQSEYIEYYDGQRRQVAPFGWWSQDSKGNYISRDVMIGPASFSGPGSVIKVCSTSADDTIMEVRKAHDGCIISFGLFVT
ncbi:hypothetical protein L210DRAFT_3507946 [Boletus edulis BED1]|uniref:Uncharacterized protein n=1 Tax=Boletus edulis BED1 TaxID=1328754 RepID=A0AAD4GA06_BOLED|nr:hypothetical protein L210DRAFT_3507946 [Boletus edulis BED1]